MMRSTRGDYAVTDDPAAVDVDAVHALLGDTYWAKGRAKDVVRTTIAHSLCFSLFHRNRQIGFARVLSDHAANSYLSDVVLDPAHRSRGLGRWLMESVLEHPAVRPTRLVLVTRDAQAFYRDLGFVTHHYECMVRVSGG